MSDKKDQEWLNALQSDAVSDSANKDIHIIEAKLTRAFFLKSNQENEFSTSNNGLMEIYEAAHQKNLFNKGGFSVISRFRGLLSELVSSNRGLIIAASLICMLAGGNIFQFVMSQVEPPELYRSSGANNVIHSVQSPLEVTEALKKELLNNNLRFSITYYSVQRIEIQIRASQEFKSLFKRYDIDIPDNGTVNIIFSRR